MRINIDRISNILTNKYWLLISLSAAFLCYYAFNRGAADSWVHICGYFVFVNIIFKEYKWEHFFNGPLVFFTLVFLLIIITSFLINIQVTHDRAISNIIEMIIAVIGIHCFYIKENDYNKCYYIFLLLLTVSVCWHAFNFYFLPVDYIEETNRNILSNFLILLIPFLCFFLITINNRKRYIFKLLILLMIAVCLDMLLKSQSRPAILGLFFAVFILFVFFFEGKARIYSSVGLMLFAALLAFTNYAGSFNKINELVMNSSNEERVVIWSDSLRMIFESNIVEIIFGHGIGSFRCFFSKYSSVINYSSYVFPHNFFLQILYESGIVGLSLFTALFIFIIYLLKLVARTDASSYRVMVFSKCLAVYFFSWIFHCGLTVGFFSKYTLYPLAFIVGCVNVLYLYKVLAKSNELIHN